MTIQFTKAVKSQAKLRMALAGPSGSGKTYSALAIALGLANGGNVALVDTEHGSAKKYAGLFDFDVLEMEPPFHPDRFIDAIHSAAQAGYAVIILDSLSHAWNGTGGLLEIVDQIATRMQSKNTFAAWKDATPIQNRLIDAIIRSDIHIIATMRSKQEYVLEDTERNGKTTKTPRKVGMAPVQRDSFEYEFDIMGELDVDHNLIISKTRCQPLDGGLFHKPGDDVAEIIRAWLSDGAVPANPSAVLPESRFVPDQAVPSSGKPTNGKKLTRQDYLNRISEIELQLVAAGSGIDIDQTFLDTASIDDLVKFGKELNAKLEGIKAVSPALPGMEAQPAGAYSE